ncbi:MAG: hypothetical protein ACK5KL_03820 [Dysgonomonas sp.]
MNKLIYVISVFILLITGFTACEVEDGGYETRPTLQGLIAFQTTQTCIYDGVAILDLMSRIDYYAQASDDEKEGIKNYYLKEYEISKTDQTWKLKSIGSEVIFTHNSKSINEIGAVWTVHITYNEGQYKQTVIDNNNFRLESSGDKKWSIKITDMLCNYMYNPNKDETHSGEFIFTGSIASNKSPFLYDFKIESGTGKIKSSPILDYEVKEALSYFYISDYYAAPTLTKGVLVIKADNKDDIIANISIPGSFPSYQITFNGITEDWGYYH